MTGKKPPPDIYFAFKALALAPNMSLLKRTVSGAILAHYNMRTGQCDPSGERLARLLGMDRRDLVKITAQLCHGDDALFDKNSHGGHSHRASYTPRWERFAAIVTDWERRAKQEDRRRLPTAGEKPALTAGEKPALTAGEKPAQTLRSNPLNELCAREAIDGSGPRDGRKGLRNEEAKPEKQRQFIYTIDGGKRASPSHAEAALERAKARVEQQTRGNQLGAWLLDNDPNNVWFERAARAEVDYGAGHGVKTISDAMLRNTAGGAT